MEGGLVASVIQQDGLSPKAIRRQLQVFLDHDIHVFFLLLTSDWEVLCLAAEMGLMGGSNVWFVDAWLWHIIKAQVNQSCTPEQIQVEFILDCSRLRKKVIELELYTSLKSEVFLENKKHGKKKAFKFSLLDSSLYPPPPPRPAR